MKPTGGVLSDDEFFDGQAGMVCAVITVEMLYLRFRGLRFSSNFDNLESIG